MATTENNGLMIYQDESGNKFILYPITKADLVDGLEELLAGKAAADHADQHASGGSDPITPGSIGAALASHNHLASDVTSGTFSTARLPTVPLTKGGTGATTAAVALYALINGASALDFSGLAAGDYLALGDVSAATGKKVTLANLLTYLESTLGGAKIETGSYAGTGTYGKDNPNTLQFSFAPKMVFITTKDNYGNNVYLHVLVVYAGYGGGTDGSTSTEYHQDVVTSIDNSVSWYNVKNSSSQCNYSKYTYDYLAIG